MNSYQFDYWENWIRNLYKEFPSLNVFWARCIRDWYVLKVKCTYAVQFEVGVELFVFNLKKWSINATKHCVIKEQLFYFNYCTFVISKLRNITLWIIKFGILQLIKEKNSIVVIFFLQFQNVLTFLRHSYLVFV